MTLPEAYRIAGFRRHYLAKLKARQAIRREIVARAYHEAVLAGGVKRGLLARLAVETGYHKSQITRDVQALRRAALDAA